MVAAVLYLAALWMIGQGVLMLLGKYTPPTARAAIDNPALRRLWCRENAFVSFGWAAVFAFYGSLGFFGSNVPGWLTGIWTGISIAGALCCAVFSYRSNRKYFKDPEKH